MPEFANGSLFSSRAGKSGGSETAEPKLLTPGSVARLRAEVLAQLYYSEDSMFGVFEVRDAGSGEVRALAGKLPKLIPGENIEGDVEVSLRENKYTGETEVQWKVVSSMRPSPPVSETAIERFLSNGFAWRVGKDVAGRLVRRYGKRTLDVFRKLEMDVNAYLEERGGGSAESIAEEDMLPALVSLSSKGRSKSLFGPLTVVDGIGAKTAASLLAGWISNRARHGVMLYLFECGLSSALADKVVKKLGLMATDIIDENPYALLDAVPGVPFSAVEKMARSRGMSADDPKRTGALLVHCVTSLISNLGHVCIPEKDLLPKVFEFSGKTGWPASKDVLESRLAELAGTGVLPVSEENGERFVYSRTSFFAERKIARAVTTLSRGRGSTVSESSAAPLVKEWESKRGIRLDESQRAAVFSSLSSRVSILTGGPGTGKTTLVGCMEYVLGKLGFSTGECAPTGKAARNMSKNASTVHRLLGLGRGNTTHGEPVRFDWLFSDETSMEDVYLASAKFAAIVEGGANSVLLGDVDQLPSVGPGAVLASLVDSGSIPVSRLSLVHRTEKGGVLDLLDFVRKGSGALSEFGIQRKLSGGVCFPGKHPDGEGLRDEILAVAHSLSSGGRDFGNMSILVPMKKGVAGTVSLNRELQKMFNASGLSGAKFESFSGDEKVLWAAGDRVMNVVNDYDNDVFNGETGTVLHVDPKSRAVSVKWPELDGKIVRYAGKELDNLLHAWATTIHKSQGSEYENVVVAMSRSSWHMAERALLYTAVSRAKKNCVILGDERTIDRAISTKGERKRVSLLSGRLNGVVEDVSAEFASSARERNGCASEVTF